MYNKLNTLLAKLKQDQRGLSTVEYVVLLVLIVAIAVAVWNVFGNTLTQKLTDAAHQFDQEVVTSSQGEAGEMEELSGETLESARGAAGAGAQ